MAMAMARGRPLLLLLLVAQYMAVLASAATENRDIDGYENSGYFWPKTILWRGIRTSPGDLWLVFFFFAWTTVGLVARARRDNSKASELQEAESRLRQALNSNDALGPVTEQLANEQQQNEDTMVAFTLGAGLLYVTLAVTRLSDAVEAYLVAMCSIQVLLDSQRTRKSVGSPSGRGFISAYQGYISAYREHVFIHGFILAAVLGIAMLDSFHALNVLNVVYSTLGFVIVSLAYALGLITMSLQLEAGHPVKWVGGSILSLAHFGFPVAAFFVARSVEGSHSWPMLAFLITAAAHFLIITCIQYGSSRRLLLRPEGVEAA